MKNLKPFDLQAALSGKAVMLRNGEKAYVRHHETELSFTADSVLLGYIEGTGAWSWCVDGLSRATNEESPYDIVGMWKETRIINGFEVPAPSEPEQGDEYFVAMPSCEDFYVRYVWHYDKIDKRCLGRGLAFLSKEDAIANAKAMLGIDPYSEAGELDHETNKFYCACGDIIAPDHVEYADTVASGRCSGCEACDGAR